MTVKIDEEYDVRLPLNLNYPVTGSRVMEVLRRLAGQEADLSYEERETNEGLLEVGLSSEDPTKHVIVYVGEKLEQRQVNPNEPYQKIGVGYYEWPDVTVDAIGYARKTIQIELGKIKGDLEKLLGGGEE